MHDATILEALESKDWSRVMEALSRLGAEKTHLPSPDVFRKAIDLITDVDPDVRHDAIFATGLHWQHPDAFPEILKVLHNNREEALVLVCAAAAIGTTAHNDRDCRDEGIRELARVVANEDMPEEVRSQAYLSALWAAGRISVDEYAKGTVPENLGGGVAGVCLQTPVGGEPA